MKPQDEALSVTQADYEMAEQYRDRHGLNGLNRDHLADLIAHVRLSHSTPGDAEVRKLLTRFVAWVARVDALDDDLRYLNGQHPDQMATERDGWDDLRDIAADALPVIATPSGRAQGEVGQ